MKTIISFLLALLLITGFSACKKDQGPGKSFAYGSINITMLDLGDGPASVTVKLNGQSLGLIGTSGTRFTIPAGVSGKLGFYQGKSDTLLLDTSVNVPKNTSVNYRVAFSSKLGIYGVICAPPNPVAPDSSYVQLVNKLDPEHYSDPVDMEIFLLDGNTYETTPTGIVFKDIFRDKLYPQGFMFTAQPKGPDGQLLNAYYVVKFKDHRTGEYVYQPAYGADWTQILPDQGHSVIMVLTSDADGNVQYNNVVLDGI